MIMMVMFFRSEGVSGLGAHEGHDGPFDTFPLACYLSCYEMTIVMDCSDEK